MSVRAILTAAATAVLVVGGALTGAVPAVAACDSDPALDAAALNGLFAGPGLGATEFGEGFGGGDYPHAYVLPGRRVLWLFQDLFFSNDDNLDQPTNNAAHNAGLLQEGDCFTILGSQGRDLIGDAHTIDSRTWFWPLDGEIDADGTLTIFMVEMYQPDGSGAGPGALPVRTWRAVLDPYSLEQLAFDPVEPFDGHLFGWSVTSTDHHSYLYSHCYRQYLNGDSGPEMFDAECMPHTYLARVPVGRFDAPYEYWTGSGWSPAVDAAVPVSSRPHANPMSVQWFGDAFVSVSKVSEWWGDRLFVDRAPAAEGPWTTVATREVNSDRRCDPGCGNYGATLLPWLDTTGRMTVGLANGGEFHLWKADGSLYRPSFYAFDVPAAVPGASAASPPAFGQVAGDSGFVAVDPVRLLDTREPGQPFGRLGEMAVGELALDPPEGATAVALNLTAVDAGAGGWVRAYPCSQPEPATSNVNPSVGLTATNAVIVPVGDGRICLRTRHAVDLVVDLNGWLTPRSDIGLTPLPGQRLVDTRTGVGDVTRLGPGAEFSVQVVDPGSAATAVMLNVTAVDPASAGYVTLWPCGAARPHVSNLNPAPGVTQPNLVNVRVGADGRVCGYTRGETDLLVDRIAEYRPAAATRYAALAPQRLLDTRVDAAGRHAGNLAPVVALGGVVAAQANVTVTQPAGHGFATTYPCFTSPLPSTSNVNYAPGRDSANSALLGAARGYGCVYLRTASEVVVDVFGVWTAPA